MSLASHRLIQQHLALSQLSTNFKLNPCLLVGGIWASNFKKMTLLTQMLADQVYLQGVQTCLRYLEQTDS
jgi:hypothetical protein